MLTLPLWFTVTSRDNDVQSVSLLGFIRRVLTTENSGGVTEARVLYVRKTRLSDSKGDQLNPDELVDSV